MRSRRLHKIPDFPPFMEEVLVRRRRWKKPSPENHGHWVVTLGERPRLTRCYMKKVEGPPNPDHWIALEKELLDGLTLRRRLREKPL